MLITALAFVLAHPAAPARLIIGLDHPNLWRTSATQQIEDVLHKTQGIEVRRLNRSLVIDVDDRSIAYAILKTRKDIRFIEEEVFFPVELKAVPDDTLYDEQWSLHPTAQVPVTQVVDIGAEAAWDITRGNGATVAVVDDGFDLTHPDLVDRFVQGFDLACDAPALNDCGGTVCDCDPTPEGNDHHGTWTAGVIGATGFDGYGITGVCPECSLIPARLIGGGGPSHLYTSGSAVAETIEAAVALGADVINNSWGFPDGNLFDPTHPVVLWPQEDGERPAGVLPQVLIDALTAAVTEGRGGLGVVITWSAGNGNELMTYDGFARDPRVLAIGSVDTNGRRSYYSDYGPSLFMVTPSSGDSGSAGIATTDIVGIPGDNPGDHQSDYGGTSASAAMAAGAAAMIIAAHPTLTAAQVMESLSLGARKLVPSRGTYVDGHNNDLGYGSLELSAALTQAATYVDECTLGFELCGDGQDNNCDGEIDENCSECLPDFSTEQCDGHDNNCDGQNNEGFVCFATDRPVCAPCDTDQRCQAGSLCRASPDFPGSYCFETCVGQEPCPTGFTCNGTVCLLDVDAQTRNCDDYLVCGIPETCDGIDNDCNGVVDDLQPGRETNAELAACDRAGVCQGRGASCVDGAWQCEAVPTFEAIEHSCDALDNDCDGEIDEELDCSGCRSTHRPSDLWMLWACLAIAMKWRRRIRRAA